MAEQVTFGIEVARALMGAGVPIRDRHNVRRRKPADRANFPPYHLPAGATLTSEQVTAAVQADPGRLAARRGFDTYVWQGCRWLFWSPVAGCLSPGAWASPAHNNGRWELVYRLDIERTPERPPRPAQGTTLRAIMEWCAWAEKGAACRRMSWCFEIGDCHINCDGDLEADEIWLSAEDAHEATDWRASTDDGKTWFVPPCGDQSAHVEAGGVVDKVRELLTDTAKLACETSPEFAERVLRMFVETGSGPRSNVHPADHMDDAPADGRGWDGEADHA